MSEPLPEALDRFLARSSGSTLVLDADSAGELAGTWDRVAVPVADRQALRALEVPPGVRSATVAVWLASGAGALALVPRPEWPALKALRAVGGPAEGWLTVVRLARPVRVADVVAELGRQAVWADRFGHGGLVVQRGGEIPDDVPPDVLLDPAAVAGEHPVTGRAPYVLRETRGPVVLGPIDERILNPTGFRSDPGKPTVDLSALDLRRGATEELVRSLRRVRGVRAELDRDPDPGLVRTVAGLAMAGVPLVATTVSPAARELLGPAVTAALEAQVDLADVLAREEHSVVLRRAALDTFSSTAWRQAVGRLAGVRVSTQPAVSVVLATKRPEQLEFAVRQVAKQRGVDDLELVLAPHGFEVDPQRVGDLAGPGVAVQVAAQPETTPFGDVLAGAASVAAGDVVLKMDDDDWYGPDVIADLLRARAYSGAELVGMPAEFHYLAPKRLTVQRGHRAEFYARFVAGGTMMVDRGLLREVGSFRSVRKFVDASLLAAVTAAGGAVYRTHGLGYLLRRNASGHTWEVDLDHLLDPSRVAVTWEGFRPSRLLEHDESELP